MDFVASNCGPPKLYGAEVTKPRKNAATATPAERDAYRQAIVTVGTPPGFVFPGGVTYWHKQQEVHRFGPTNRHGTPAFLPWHREFVNRYEVLLQEADPLVKLLYWDWTTDPANSTGGVNLFTSSFMGASGRGTGGVSVGAPFQPALGAPAITRNLSISTTPPAFSDLSLVGLGNYPSFAPTIENPSHDFSHGYIGGGGNMSFIPTAAEDPFFFLLHTNVDRIWAQWQRRPTNLTRLDPATAYDGNASNANITTALAPWNGVGTPISPWTTGGGAIVSKTPTDMSVVSPPFYDTAPLTIPVLQPGQAVIIQIPWYPPNPADFSCFGDQQHFCLLGRVETSSTSPFGMTSPETADVNANTRNNNNIVWKNISVVDNFTGALASASIVLRNTFREPVLTTFRFAETDEIGRSFLRVGRIMVDLKPELFRRFRATAARSRGIEVLGDRAGLVRVMAPLAEIAGITLAPQEVFPIDVRFELPRDYQPTRGIRPKWDLLQVGAPGRPEQVVGGQRFEIEFDNIFLVKARETWRYLDDGSDPGNAWIQAEYDDSTWKTGFAELGFADEPRTTIDPGQAGRQRMTTYFRHTFDVADPQFFRSLLLRLKRDDGAVVYLNGREIHRVNLPAQRVAAQTPATRSVEGLEEEMFFPARVDPGLLRAGPNVIAAELHQDSLRSGDASFDLELSGNSATTSFPPNVRIVSPAHCALLQAGRPMEVQADALDSDGRITSVALFAGDKLIGRDSAPPFTFRWPDAGLGVHRLRVEALDDQRQSAIAEAVVTVVSNTPPAVRLIRPADGSGVVQGGVIAAAAEASDAGGSVARVEFFVRDADLFVAPQRLVGSARRRPYTVQIRSLAPGHYMLLAVAVDNRGLRSPSVPVHFMVTAR